MGVLRKIWKFISSMQFAIGLLLVLALACSVGSVITQGQTYAVYAEQYGERAAGAIVALQLDDLFHSWWFVLLSAFLCLNLLFCNLIRLPSILKLMKREADPMNSLGREGNVSVSGVKNPEGLFKAMGFGKIISGESELRGQKTSSGTPAAVFEQASEACEAGEIAAAAKDAKEADGTVGPEEAAGEAGGTDAVNSAEGAGKSAEIPEGRGWKFSVKNRIGLWGAWVCHLGILLLILGFGLGQATKEVYTVYGLPGDSKAVAETGLILTIDSFDIGLREDETVEQYTAGITVRRPADGAEESARISVNNPASMFGMTFFQNSTGWAADIHIKKNGEALQDEAIYVGEYTAVADMPNLVIYLNAFYPDYVLDESGPMSASSSINNPAYLYSVYYQGQMLGMNALLESEELTIDDYTVTFDNPRNYTLIQVKRDRFTYLALLGGLVVMFGLIFAFYTQEARIWALRDGDGSWTVYGASRKGGVLFDEQFRDKAKKFK